MADSTEQRYLVEWTERVTHQDIAYASEEQARVGLGFSEQTWDDFDAGTRVAMVRQWLNAEDGVEGLKGTRRWRVVGRSGFDVTQSAPWPDGAPEPQL